MKKTFKSFILSALASICLLGSVGDANALTYEEYPTIRLRSLDKITARTLTFDAQVGTVIKFGDIYIKILACRKPPAVEKTESAAFLQIWEVDKTKEQSRWIFSGWMFASSPSLSGMDHPVYDVWAIDCLGKDPDQPLPPTEPSSEKPLQGEGEVSADQIKEPEAAPEQTLDTQPEPTPPPSEQPAPETETSLEDEAQPQETTPEQQPEQKPEPESFDGIY
ncbi:MAG TPA: DUF2155 domain-containing protein [Alphaproteobacteria bacterium]|nr:DUF2155 domain-containing protein [Alphaproteobacteria bacterium]